MMFGEQSLDIFLTDVARLDARNLRNACRKKFRYLIHGNILFCDKMERFIEFKFFLSGKGHSELYEAYLLRKHKFRVLKRHSSSDSISHKYILEHI